MPRYLIERSFEEGNMAPVTDAQQVASIVRANTRDMVTWIHSYVSTDLKRMFCIYEADTPEAVRHASAASQLPIVSITEVSMVDPYLYALGAEPPRRADPSIGQRRA